VLWHRKTTFCSTLQIRQQPFNIMSPPSEEISTSSTLAQSIARASHKLVIALA